MTRQVEMAEKQLSDLKTSEEKLKAFNDAKAKIQEVANKAKPMSEAMLKAQQSTLAALTPSPSPVIDTLAQFERQAKETTPGEDKAKGLVSMSDMKKRLDAFKAAKNIEAKMKKDKLVKKVSKQIREPSPEIIEVNENAKSWENKREVEEERGMSPLELLRKYTMSKRKIAERDGLVYFREISFPKSCRTNMKIQKPSEVTGGGKEYYSLGCLLHFLDNIHMDHPEYVRKCISDEQECVRRNDRGAIRDYLFGAKEYVLNLDHISHRELNPQLFGGEEFLPEARRSGSRESTEYGGAPRNVTPLSEYGGG